jgi:hypothetical protein
MYAKLPAGATSRIFARVRAARSTGDVTSLMLLRQRVCVSNGVCVPGIHHVGLLAVSEYETRIFEHGPVRSCTVDTNPTAATLYDAGASLYDAGASLYDAGAYVPLPSVHNSIADIAAFERTLPRHYVLGVRDCRHHALDLLTYLYPDPDIEN